MLAIPSCIVSQAAVTPQAMLSNALLFVGTLQETLRVQFRRWDGGTDGRQDRAACAPAQGRWDGRTPGSGCLRPRPGTVGRTDARIGRLRPRPGTLGRTDGGIGVPMPDQGRWDGRTVGSVKARVTSRQDPGTGRRGHSCVRRHEWDHKDGRTLPRT
jgi:hypothetical protein